MQNRLLDVAATAGGDARERAGADPEEKSLEQFRRERAELLECLFHLDRLGQAGLLASGLVQDARRMMTAISCTCQLTLGHADMAAYRDGLAKANTLAQRSGEALEAFLAFARRSGPHSTVCSVSDLAADALRFVAPVVAQGSAAFDRNIEPGVLVRADRTLLLQALVNLLQNAAHALLAPSGRVQLTVRREGEQAIVEVAESGIAPEPAAATPHGSPAAASPLPGRAGPARGTGPWLFVTRKIAEELGGRLSYGAGVDLRPTYLLALPAAPRVQARPSSLVGRAS